MNNEVLILDDLISRYPDLLPCKEQIINAFQILKYCFENKNKLVIAGNGGSSSDAEHIVGELMKSFKKKRNLSSNFVMELKKIDNGKGSELAKYLQNPLPAISLSSHQSLNTAIINDISNGGEFAFAQQLLGLGLRGDVFLAISTSGNSKNLIYAAIVAKAKGMKVIGLTGKDGGQLKNYSDTSVIVQSNETYLIQERHLPIYHCLCLMLEDHFFPNK